MDKLEPEHVQWTKNMLDGLKVGGTWIIPRSLLVVTRTGDSEANIALMPETGSTKGAYEFAEAHLEKGVEQGVVSADISFRAYQWMDATEVTRHAQACGYIVTLDMDDEEEEV